MPLDQVADLVVPAAAVQARSALASFCAEAGLVFSRCSASLLTVGLRRRPDAAFRCGACVFASEACTATVPAGDGPSIAA